MANILFITNSLGFGGAAKILCFVAENLAIRGHSVNIVNLKTTVNKTPYEREIDKKVIIYTIDDPPENKNKNIYYISKISKIAMKTKSEVIIGFTSFPNLYAKIVGTLLHIPSIMSERGDPSIINKSLKTKIVRFIVNHSSGGVFQTEDAMKYYGRGLRKRGIVIPNPIFIRGEIPIIKQSEREKTVVSVARFDNKQKRYDIMLKAFQLFSRKHPDYVLKLYGEGEDEGKVREWVNELGLYEKVIFMGLTTQPIHDIAKDGIFIITSDYEGISNALLEAMALGIPCVSTDHTPGGARLLIQDHENGILVPAGNYQKIAEALCEYAENPELAAKCGENAKKVLDRFDPNRIIDVWEEYIRKIIQRV